MYTYYDGFTAIKFREEIQGGETFVYEEMIGDYGKTYKVMENIHIALLNDEKIVSAKGAGVYYDSPKEVEKSKLRSEIGSITVDLDSGTIERLAEKYKVKTLPKNRCLVTELPYKGTLSGIVAVMKVMPAMEKYCQQYPQNYGPIMEIYDAAGYYDGKGAGKIIFRKIIYD
jgi:hypothetical protein